MRWYSRTILKDTPAQTARMSATAPMMIPTIMSRFLL